MPAREEILLQASLGEDSGASETPSSERDGQFESVAEIDRTVLLPAAGRREEHTRPALISEKPVCAAPAVTRLGAGPPLSAHEALPERIESWGRFRELKWVGAGGMGSVFRAIDPSLQRTVALKFVHSKDPEVTERFLQEARSQAQVEHRHICRVYQVGEGHGRQFIVMQFVDGETFDQVAPRLEIVERVRIAQKVALALYAAHSAGLIHRDIKPANILIEKDPQGRWQPIVVDFGLAKTVEEAGSGHSENLVGTPWYMSPEQAQASPLDARSDIFSLGSTLYEILSGKRAFSGEKPLSALVKVVEYDPPNLSEIAPEIPRDLATIVSKCMRKDVASRYHSALELAADLQRFLDGEPVAALPASWTYRLNKKIRKHKMASGLISGALALALLFGAIALHSRATAAERQKLAGELAENVEEIEWSLSVAHLSPSHDIRSDYLRIRGILENIEKRMPNLDRVGLGASHLALGRGELSMGNLTEAREHLEAARDLTGPSPDLAYLLGETYQKLYDVELSQLPIDAERELIEQWRLELQTEFRDPAIEMLQVGRASEHAMPELIEARIARLEGRTEDSLENLAAIVEQSPQSYAALREIGVLHLQQAQRLRGQGAYLEARATYALAEQSFSDAVEIGRSDPESWLGLCDTGVEQTKLQARYLDEDPSASVGLAEEACAQLEEILPHRSLSLLRSATVELEVAHWKLRRGQALDDELDRAMESAEKARALMDEPRGYFSLLGDILLTRYDATRRRGEAMIDDLERAAEALRKAVEYGPNLAVSQHDLGLSLITLAEETRRMGEATEELLIEAEQHLKRAVDLSEDSSASMVVLGRVFFERGLQAQRLLGREATPHFRQATTWTERALAANPERSYLHNYIAVYALATSDELLARGQEPVDLEKAREAFEAAMRLAPEDPIPRMNFPAFASRQAAYDRIRAQNPIELAARSEKEMLRGLEAFPGGTGAIAETIETYRQSALFALDHDLPVEKILSTAKRWIRRGLDIQSDDGEVLLAKVRLAMLRRDSGLSSSMAELDGASSDLEIALADRADLAGEILVTLAELNALRIDNGADDSETLFARAIANLEEALKKNPSNARVYAIRARLYASRGENELALRDLDQALEMNRFLEVDFGSLLRKLEG